MVASRTARAPSWASTVRDPRTAWPTRATRETTTTRVLTTVTSIVRTGRRGGLAAVDPAAVTGGDATSRPASPPGRSPRQPAASTQSATRTMADGDPSEPRATQASTSAGAGPGPAGRPIDTRVQIHDPATRCGARPVTAVMNATVYGTEVTRS